MTKQELTERGFKYISTQNCGQKTELWAKLTGYLDTIQYVYYLPNVDKTILNSPNTISYLQIDMFTQLRDKMKNDLLKNDIKYDNNSMWYDKNTR